MNQRILVIEDDEAILNLVKETLELEGYLVLTAAEGKEGLEKITAEEPDLIILDVMLPEIDGWEVLFQIKENPLTANLPVIMFTGKVDSISKLFGLKHGADWNDPRFLGHLNQVVKRYLVFMRDPKFSRC